MTTWTATREERDAVMSWRGGQLRASGFGPALAASLAADVHVDLHELIELVERGCPPPLAARIVAPLDGESA
jgi:hypothetical protein